MNIVILIGNLGSDPELRYTAGSVPVAKVGLATTERWKDADGNKQEKTVWHNLVAWRRNAEVMNEYCRKGHKLMVRGRIDTESWDDKNSGEKKYKTVIVVDQLELLEKRSSTDNGADPLSVPAQFATPGTPAAASSQAESDLPF